MSTTVLRFLLIQRARESGAMVEAGLLAIALRGFLRACLGNRHGAVSDLSQVHRTTRIRLTRRLAEPYIRANIEATHRGAPAAAHDDVSRYFGNRLLVLKEPRPGGERGVLLVMFSEMLPLMSSAMDVRRLLEDYTLVLEPSWSGYCDRDILWYTQFNQPVFVLSAQTDDFAFLSRLASNLVPLDIGPCDWVDPRVAEPYLGSAKEFDIVFNAHWGASKRHHALFRMLKRAKQRYKTLLIGGPWAGRTLDDVKAMADYYGVSGQLDFVEHIPYDRVMELTCKAKVALLLSLKEGSNRAISEAIFCDVPAVVLANHVGGIVKNVVPETGLLVPEWKVEWAIEELSRTALSPRRWALDHISCFKSTEKLNARLRSHAEREGLPWTRDIAVRASSPESKFVFEEDQDRLAPWNRSLIRYPA